MIPYDQAPEHEFEAELGLPQPLPRGEHVLWQGAPQWRVMAREVFHTRTLTAYFGVLLAWRAANALSAGGSALDAAMSVAWLAPLAGLALLVLFTTAWLVSRAAVYTITDQRVVVRIGVVLSVTFNLPYARIDSVALHANRDGSGNLSLLLEAGEQIAYVHLWPHARPWHLKRTQPMLRALADVHAVASILSAALAAHAGTARTHLSAVPSAVPSPTAIAARPLAAHPQQRPVAA